MYNYIFFLKKKTHKFAAVSCPKYQQEKKNTKFLWHNYVSQILVHCWNHQPIIWTTTTKINSPS